LSDYYQSHTLSLVLTWISSIAVFATLIALIFLPIQILFANEFANDGVAFRIAGAWVMLCFLALSPLRYNILQIFILTAYSFQSFGAFISAIYLASYVPIVCVALYFIGIALPFLGIITIAGFKEPFSKIRLCLSALAAPLFFSIANYLFFLALPLAAYSVHWLRADDVIRATNGPAELIYKYTVEPMTPLIFPGYVNEMGFDKLSSKERLRAHIAAVYLGEKEFSLFMYRSYPEEFKRKTGHRE